MKQKTFIIIALLMMLPLVVAAADNASQTLDKAAAKLRTAKSVTAAYTLSTSQGSSAGTLTLAGDKFAMNGNQVNIWYDGKTQWTYVSADNEVNVSEPTAQELQQINPFIIINTFRQNYTAKTVSKAKNAQKITLTAKNSKTDIRSATVTINPATLLPSEIVLKMASGQTATIRISSIKIGNALPVSTFRFPAKKYPKAEVIDLR